MISVHPIFSYGHKNDRIEMSGLLTGKEYAGGGNVKGGFTAEAVFERINKHWM